MVFFIVTGFGPFGRITENPTTILANNLVEFLRETESEHCSSTRTLVIETSAAAAREQVDNLYQELAKESDNDSGSANKKFVIVHLGVNESARGFALESCAYNNATFMLPDQRGNRCWRQLIVNGTLEAKYATLLDVTALAEGLNSTNSTTADISGGPSVTVSTNPGRFVCNYTYCYSLDKFQCSDQSESTEHCAGAPNVRCLFVHVPPFSVIPEREQLQFVATLLEAIEQQLSHPTVASA